MKSEQLRIPADPERSFLRIVNISRRVAVNSLFISESKKAPCWARDETSGHADFHSKRESAAKPIVICFDDV